ncbi:LexA family transcriptional regulator [Xenorhabdus sp. XENO-10]|uniref:LexA family transcriptional regulator n=1 Tax=Xenorhabdus yunnanensis TaxID=3025878 RepID=A0ABT5LKB6_9GAMM|nr:LexA family transcriptional regulator [Xenorhabdus yunnanensis]MDC9591414.1 LexA family transcriptional regulator [Xenorhabdus yunnanensis]
METIGQRIKRFRERLDISQTELAQRCGWGSQSRIGNYEANIRKVSVEDAVVIASSLKISPGELLFGTSDTGSFMGSGEQQLPLVHYDQVSMFTDPNQLLAPDNISEYIAYSGIMSELGFAFRMQGDAMKPEFMDGDIIVIDPMVAPSPGEFTIACVEGRETIFRKYRLKSKGSFELIPLNSDYPAIDSDEYPVIIIGTMVEQRITRRKR